MNALTTTTNGGGAMAYDRISNVAEFINSLGNDIAKSGMFGCSSLEQGRVLAAECVVRRSPPMSLAEKYDIIHGKLSMKSQAMLAKLRTVGGWKTTVVEKSPERAAIKMVSPDGHEFIEELTWEQMKQEATPYEGKEAEIVKALAAGKPPALKPKYATPRSRGNMLWNRLISDAVRTHAPEIVCGFYTPEEIEDFTPGQAVTKAGGDDGEVVDGEFEVKKPAPDEPAPGGLALNERQAATNGESSTSTPEAPAPVGLGLNKEKEEIARATDSQRKEILELFVQLQINHEAQTAILAKRGVNTLRGLTAEQADELIGKLKSTIQVTAKEPAPEPDDRRSARVWERCTEAHVDRIKLAIKQLAQVGVPDIAERVKSLLVRNGIQRLAELSIEDAEKLHQLLAAKNVEAFVELTLTKPAANEAGASEDSGLALNSSESSGN